MLQLEFHYIEYLMKYEHCMEYFLAAHERKINNISVHGLMIETHKKS